MDSTSDSVEREERPRTAGAILAAERERLGLSRADVAQRLHMSASQVEALEASDYERLPRGTFLRGFTRNYARALGLDADALVGLLAEDAPLDRAPPPIVVPTQNIRFDPLGQRLANPYVKAAGIAAVVIVLGFSGMYWWLFIRPQAAPTAVKKPAVEAPKEVPVAPPAVVPTPPAAPNPVPSSTVAPPPSSSASTTPAAGSAPVPAPAASPSGATRSPSAKSTPAASPEPAAAQAPRTAGPGEGTLRFTFRAAAWVEITDARGKVLLSRTHPGGSTTEVIGKPPFTLVIGNAPEVRLVYNDREVDLAPHTRVAVARFTLP